MPEISVIMPYHADTIEKSVWATEAIESLQIQSFQNWELIFIDDSSIYPAKFPQDERIRYFKTPSNKGPALCRNTAVALARSEAILPLDSDDILAHENVLSSMFNAWLNNPERVVYGDLQRLENGQAGKVFNLPEYSFQRSLNLNGIMPVTAMHSKECHIKAGGYKAELDAGLEDVEYWIAAGKAGFCGYRIHEIVLLYRRHDYSRAHKLRMVNRRETEMRNKIRQMHQDVFEGRYPMGCCGGRGGYEPPQVMNSQAMVSAPTTLSQFASDEKVWVQYNGKRTGSFGVRGQFTSIDYQIQGPNHKLEVHNLDLPKFRRAGRGKDFTVGVAPPEDHKPVQEDKPEDIPFEAPEPVLAEIVELDHIAKGSQPKPEPEPEIEEVFFESAQPDPQDYDLSKLELSEKITQTLTMESWSIQALAEADIEILKRYPGIGQKTANDIISKAKSLI